MKAGANVKFEIKTGSTFRKDLQRFLATRLRDLKAEVDSFVEDGIKQIRGAFGPDTNIVFIFDQLEQLRGTFQTEREVVGSVERIFASSIDMLKLPYLHMIYTIPPWLKFLLRQSVRVTLLPAIHLWSNDDGRSKSTAEWDAFRSLVARRLGEEGARRLLGADSVAASPLVDQVIDVCGGQFRDLLRILKETLVRAMAMPALPINETVVTSAVNAARSEFLPISLEDAKWLAEIARLRTSGLPSTDPVQVTRLARFLDNHSVLYFKNGSEWYDVHPLIRDEIDKVVAAATPPG